MVRLLIFMLSGLLFFNQYSVVGSAPVVPTEPVEPVAPSYAATMTNEDLQQYQPNELGGVVVIMYHNLVADEAKEGFYARTPENLKKDLTRLWQEGYLPVSIDDYVNGTIDIPIGKSPVVFTFDDGYQNSFQFLPDGTLDPNCAIGVFEDFYREHPDFVPKVTFYINQSFFGDDEFSDKKAEFFNSQSNYQLGNHTIDHSNLRRLTKENVARVIVEQGAILKDITGQTAFHFAVPFGEKPKQYFDWIGEPDWLGEYQMLSSLNVGWNPAPSPYDINFNKYSINRITCGEDDFELFYWLDILKNHPEKRYISDGNPTLVSVPAALADNLNIVNGDLKPIIYDETGVIE